MENRAVIYQVTYQDDHHRTHIAFVKGYSQVRFIEDRFGKVDFEITSHYYRDEGEDSDINLFSLGLAK